MTENFKIRQGLSSDLFDLDGNLKSSVILEQGCWYLCIDTANVYICTKEQETLVLKSINSEILNKEIAKVLEDLSVENKNKKTYQKITDESELPTDFDDSNFDANIIYYIVTDTEKLLAKLFIFDQDYKKYICINKPDLDMLSSEDSFLEWLKNKSGLITVDTLTESLSDLETKLSQLADRITLTNDDLLERIAEAKTDATLDSKSYTDTREQAIIELTQKYTDKAEENLIALAAETAAEINETLDEKTLRLSKNIEDISNYIGGSFDELNTVDKAIKDIKEEVLSEVQDLKSTEISANTQKINKEISDRKAALADIISSVGNIDERLSNRIGSLEDWKLSVSNVLTFVGVSLTDPNIEAVSIDNIDHYKKGDVVLFDGREFVNVTGTNTVGSWEEFGISTATDAAVDLLKTRLTTAEQAIQTVSDSLGTKVAIQELDAYKALVNETFETKTDSNLIEQRLKAVEEELLAQATDIILLNNKLDIDIFNAFLESYNIKILEFAEVTSGLEESISGLAEDIASNLSEIALLKNRTDILEATYSDEQVNTQINTIVALEQQRAETVENQIKEQLDLYNNYFNLDENGNFPSVIVFDCGGAN